MNFSFSPENLIEKEKGKTLIVYWLKRIFIDDWVMKLVALVITVALWLGVTGLQAPTTRTINNITLSPLLAKDLEITNDSFIKEVDLELSGDKRKIDNINTRDLVVTYDITDLQAGDREIQLTPQNINVTLPSGVTVTKIIPEKLAVKLENVIEGEVFVEARTEGDLSKGYEVYSRKIIPDRVMVRGPESIVKGLKFVPTEKIDLSERRDGFVAQKVPINVTNLKVSLIDSVATTVTFRIGKHRVAIKFTVPYETENRKGRADVTLYGADTILDNLSTDDIKVIEVDGNSRKLKVILPEEIRNEIEIRNTMFRDNRE